MSYQIYATPRAVRSIKKLSPPVKSYIKNQIQKLSAEPGAGQRLRGKLRDFHSLHITHKKVEYRVVYQVFSDDKEIAVHYAATRENFYKEFQRR